MAAAHAPRAHRSIVGWVGSYCKRLMSSLFAEEIKFQSEGHCKPYLRRTQKHLVDARVKREVSEREIAAAAKSTRT